MKNQTSQYTTEYEILELLKLKLYQRLHGLAPVLGAVKFRIEEPKQPEPNGGVKQESADKACAGFWTDGRVFYLSPSRIRSDFLKDSDFLCQELLHMLSHCLLGHPFEAWRVEREERKTWESDCDEKAWALTEELWGKAISEKPPADDHGLWGQKPDEREKAFWQGQGEKLLRSGNPRGKRKAGTAKRHRTPTAGSGSRSAGRLSEYFKRPVLLPGGQPPESGRVSVFLVHLRIGNVWKYAADRTAGIQRGTENRRPGHCHRYLRFL